MQFRSLCFASLFALAACFDDGPEDYGPGEVLVIGDSVMWWNSDDGASVADVMARVLDEPVINGSVPGARISAPEDDEFDIRNQYIARDWRWVVMDGGANDLGDECGCSACDGVLAQMVDNTGSGGEIPRFVDRMVADGAKVLVMGYYPAPPASDFAACQAELLVLNTRLERMADQRSAVYFATAEDVIVATRVEDYDPDRVHPSVSGSRKIGEMLARAIQVAE